jgi:hypothetical protein
MISGQQVKGQNKNNNCQSQNLALELSRLFETNRLFLKFSTHTYDQILN